jgi:tripartite-type tricarboxylate transporter receptor subunit TctC
MHAILLHRIFPFAAAARIAACSLLAALATNAAAQAFPQKPVRMIVPLAAGGSTDVLARLIGSKLTELWSQNVIVENKPGGGTTIGNDFVAKSPADGYTILMATSAYAVNFSLLAKVPYKQTDLTALSNAAQTPNVLVVHPSVPVKSLKELIALLKARPGQLTFSSGGIGGSSHLAGELFKVMANVDITHVPYKGGSLAVTDVVAGHIPMTFGNLTSVLPFARAGRLRVIAVSSAKRSPHMAETPTMAEAGLPGFEAATWNGLIAPTATPPEVVNKLNADIVRVLALPEVRDKLAANALEPIGDSPAAFQAFINAEIARWARVVKSANLKPD